MNKPMLFLVLGLALIPNPLKLQAASFEPLGDLPIFGFRSEARDLSADGSVVVGKSDHAFRWTSATGLIDLGTLTDPGRGSDAIGVSADGKVVVGYSNEETFPGSGSSFDIGFRWTDADGMISLGVLGGGGHSYPYSASGDGSVIVGYGVSPNGVEAFRWTSADGMVGLGDLPGGSFSSYATDVSSDGNIVVGTGRSANGSEAFRWTSTDGIVGLGDLPGLNFISEAYAVSADGSIVVGTGFGGSGREAFMWTADEGMVGLGDLPGGAHNSRALGVTPDGNVIVGTGHSDSGIEAFVWTKAEGMRSLASILVNDGVDLTGWVLSVAVAVSDDGQTIVGTGKNPNGRTEAFLAKIPRASTSAYVLQPGPDDGKDIWTTSVFSYAPGGGGPGGGLDNEMLVTGGWGDQYYSLIEFDLSAMPTEAISARLELFTAPPRNPGRTGLYLDRITEFWDWRTQGTGADNERLWWADRPAAEQWNADALPTPTVGEWYSIDITELYNGWQSGTYPNFGIQLRPTSTTNAWTEFYSSDYLDSPALRPKLVVEDFGNGTCNIDVSRFSQGDVRWEDTPLDTSPYNETIGSHGCALTALATAISAAPDSLVNPTPIDLNNIAAFDAEANLDWWATPRRVQGNLKFVGLRFDSDVNPAQAMDFIKQGVCDNETPVIVQVPNPTYLKPHFVLVTGINGDSISIVDPGYADRTNLSAYGNRFKTRGYVQDPPGDISAVSIHVSPDTPFLIVDEFGNRTGVDPVTGEVLQEVHQSAYFVDAIANDVTGEAPFSQSHLAHVFQPYSGSYEIQIHAVNDQDVEIAVFSFSTDGEEQPTITTNVPVFAREESIFELTIDTATGGQSIVERLVPVPEGLGARSKSGKVSLVWSPIDNADSYNVYRSNNAGGPYGLITADHVTSYATYLDSTVTNGLTYYYVVTTLIDGVESDPSNEASATPSSRPRR